MLQLIDSMEGGRGQHCGLEEKIMRAGPHCHAIVSVDQTILVNMLLLTVL